MSRGRMDTMSLADVNALGEDDRKAVMEMVRDGEMDLEIERWIEKRDRAPTRSP